MARKLKKQNWMSDLKINFFQKDIWHSMNFKDTFIQIEEIKMCFQILMKLFLVEISQSDHYL